MATHFWNSLIYCTTWTPSSQHWPQNLQNHLNYNPKSFQLTQTAWLLPLFSLFQFPTSHAIQFIEQKNKTLQISNSLGIKNHQPHCKLTNPTPELIGLIWSQIMSLLTPPPRCCPQLCCCATRLTIFPPLSFGFARPRNKTPPPQWWSWWRCEPRWLCMGFQTLTLKSTPCDTKTRTGQQRCHSLGSHRQPRLRRPSLAC